MSKDNLTSLDKQIIKILESYPDASIPIPILLDALSLSSKKDSQKLKTSVNKLKQKDILRISKGNLVRLN